MELQSKVSELSLPPSLGTITQKDFTAFSHQESLKSYMHFILLKLFYPNIFPKTLFVINFDVNFI
jgi:hypothetical protein